jgi:EthD domain
VEVQPKAMFVWRPGPQRPLSGFAAEARGEMARRLGGLGATEVVLHLTEDAPPRLSPLPWRREPLALLSARGEAPVLEAVARALSELPGSLHGYRVEASVPVARPCTWPPGTRAPGACLLTFFKKNARLDREAFFREWHQVHTPLSLEIHPLWGYTRNAVQAVLVPGSSPWDGIVTEDFRTPEDLLRPHRLFGGALRALPNMARVGLHVSKFLELSTLENYLVAEYALPV